MEFTRTRKNIYTTISERSKETYYLLRYPNDQGGVGFASCSCLGFRHSKTNSCKHSHALVEQVEYESLTEQEIAALFNGIGER